ncbi:MAG: hypothetical protein ACP5JB_03830 [candidate division WOR-3 bacterium]|jgi:hypothetical protein
MPLPLLVGLGFTLLSGGIITDTVGWTTRDRQFPGPALRYLVSDPQRGLHIIYKDDYGAIRYNFKPIDGDWRFPQPLTINRYPRNLGCLDINITNGRALISADYLNRGERIITCFIDRETGAAAFEEVEIARGLRFSLVGAGRYGYRKFAGIKNDSLYYCSPWSARNLGPIGPFPLHNFTASKLSSRLGFVWTDYRTGRLFFRETPDGGGTWYPMRRLSDSIPGPFRFSRFGAALVYDSIQPHLVCDLYDGQNLGAVQLWHYCQYQEPQWSLITEYRFPDTSRLGTGTAALDRPSIAIDRRKVNSDLNRLFVVWEQFDPENIDPVTGIARADIWASFSPDNGRTWSRALRLTEPDQTSKRFPVIAESAGDTLHILYFADQQAGTWELGEGSPTCNPVIHLQVPAELFFNPGTDNHHTHPQLPTIVSSRNLGQMLPAPLLFDRAGRKIPAHLIPRLRPGIYFLPTGKPAQFHPLVVTD